MSSEIAIRINDLSKCYQIYDKPRHRLLQLLVGGRKQLFREFWALRNISFDVKRGETVAIIGRNGSGKSTLLQLLCGTLNPTSGSVETNGRVAALLELGAGFNPEFTGRENVHLNATILGLTPVQIEEKLPAIETFAEIGPFIDQPVKTYSSGMYVRLAFSVAVHTDPSILVVDEALSVGDARFQAKCLNHIKRMKEQGVSILFVSHDINAVRSLCDRSIWLDGGTVRRTGEVFPITAEYMEHIFNDSSIEGARVAHQGADSTNGPSGPSKQKPINHWGTQIGTILRADLYDTQGQQKNVFVGREKIQARIQFRVPHGADRNFLSISLSIKDLSGSDLIVASTWNNENTDFPIEQDVFEVCFELENCLNTGEYVLVAAVEDRSNASMQYYEYVEGAQYFSTLFPGSLSGRFIPQVELSVTSSRAMCL
jgi:lipopolysaccharide transport system ATP-binding protein